MIAKNENLPHNCDNCQMEEQHEIRHSKADFRNTEEQGIHSDMRRLQSPVFNIHIHVPPYKGDSSKIYVPRIQPVIHLHFDELARKLEVYREEQNEETTFRVLQNLLRMTSPKFGDVKFHYKDESPESVITNSENCIKTPSSSHNHCNDISINIHANIEVAEDSVTENSMKTDCSGSHDYSTNGNMSPVTHISENRFNSEEQLRRKLQKDYNLKEAVVVLTDVIKSEYYKNLIVAHGEKDKNESPDSTGIVGSTAGEKNGCRRNEESIPRVKQENESYLPDSLSLDDREKRDEIIRRDSECAASNPSCAAPAGTTDNTSDSISLGGPEKTLTALAEGCNFSELLNRFRIKYHEEYDPVKCFEHKNKDEICDVLTVGEGQNYELNGRIHEQRCSEEIARADQSGSKDENVSGDVEKSYFEDYLESAVNMGDRSAHTRGSNFKSGGIKTEDTAFEFQINPRYDCNSGSDTGDTVSENPSTKKEVTSCSEAQINPFSETSHTPLNYTHELTENYVANSRSSILRVALMHEGMGKRDKSRSERGNASQTDSVTSASPKKMKPSKEESENLDANKQKSSGLEEYIPLQASGPTKFAVAPLDSFNPYKTHDARNFKKEMLFGNRVRRFSSPDVLRVYKLKQKALKDNLGK